MFDGIDLKNLNLGDMLNQLQDMENKSKDENRYLMNAWHKYGEDKFKVQILETCSSVRDTLMFLEQKYLDLIYKICPD